MSATAIATAPSFNPSFIARNKVVSVTRNLSYPSRLTAYPSWSQEEKPLRLFIHEESRLEPVFQHTAEAHEPATSNAPTPAAPNNAAAAPNSQQPAVGGASWCLAVLKKLRTFGERILSQLTARS